jgi:hypothetical protein
VQEANDEVVVLFLFDDAYESGVYTGEEQEFEFFDGGRWKCSIQTYRSVESYFEYGEN